MENGRERLYRQFVAEEVASSLRHGLVNKIAAVGALSFHLRRQLPAAQTPPAAQSVFPMIDAELSQATLALDRHFLEPAVPPGEAADVGRVVQQLLAALPRGAGVALAGPASGAAAVRVFIDEDELAVALQCLVENAIEAVGPRGAITVGLEAAGADAEAKVVAVVVGDDGPGMDEAARRRAREAFFTTRPGRLGLGLAIATRIAHRWRGSLALDDRPGGGLRARLLLPAAPP